MNGQKSSLRHLRARIGIKDPYYLPRFIYFLLIPYLFLTYASLN